MSPVDDIRCARAPSALNAVSGLLCLLALTLAGCPTSLPEALGGQCQLNSECDAPLVCRIAFCRKECSTSRDCAAGLDCVHDNMGLGACQLVEELSCVLDSDCAENLVCTMGECTNECNCPDDEPCRDCPPGATCVARDDGTRGCIDKATRACVWDSDCEATADSFVCAPDRRCRVACRDDGDCRFGDRCAQVSFDEPGRGTVMGSFCVDPSRVSVDAGLPDGG